MKQSTKNFFNYLIDKCDTAFGLFLAVFLGFIFGLLLHNFSVITVMLKENQDIKKQYEQLWSAFYDNQERMNGLSEFQREQAEVVIQIADKINGAVVMGISDKEVFEEMKRREAFLTE